MLRNICILLLVAVLCTVTYAKKVYPWGGGDVNERSEDILEALRKNLRLETFQDSISKVFKVDGNNNLHMKNDEGVSFVAKLKAEIITDAKEVISEVGQVVYDVNTLDAQLRSSCAVMSIDYWNYEWCHRRHVSQFHLEQQGNGFVKAPEWSLGKYSRSVFIRENDADIHNETVPITKVVDYFTGGQHCEENNSSRSTEVHVQCCEGQPVQNYIPTDIYYAQKARSTGPPMPKATMNILEEPNTCAYKAVVCTPLLCKPNKSVAAVNTGNSVLTNVMASLNNSCLMRQEDWWTYELCFTKGVRQLRINVEQSVLPDGSVEQKKVVVNQYILGNPLLDVYANETALAERVTSHHATTSSSGGQQPQREAVSAREAQIIASSGLVSPLFHTRGKEPKHLELEFTNGTACDIDNVNRSIVVELYCGLTNSILSTWEDSTCHYRMKAELTILCTLPDFVPRKDNMSTIEIAPLFPVEDEEEEAVEGIINIISTATTAISPSEAPLKRQQELEKRSLELLVEQALQGQFEVIQIELAGQEKEEEVVLLEQVFSLLGDVQPEKNDVKLTETSDTVAAVPDNSFESVELAVTPVQSVSVSSESTISVSESSLTEEKSPAASETTEETPAVAETSPATVPPPTVLSAKAQISDTITELVSEVETVTTADQLQSEQTERPEQSEIQLKTQSGEVVEQLNEGKDVPTVGGREGNKDEDEDKQQTDGAVAVEVIEVLVEAL